MSIQRKMQTQRVALQGRMPFQKQQKVQKKSSLQNLRRTVPRMMIWFQATPIDYTVDYISEKDGWNTSKLLTSNGELWDLYPEASCIKRNVKDYVSEWVYSGSDAAHVEYALDYDNVLWSGETKIAENIQKYDGHYALTADHMLIDIYNDQGTRLEGVSDWVQDVSTEYDETGESYKWTTTYVLKQDGTLWSREEVEKSAAVTPFQKVTNGVKQLFEGYYLADDGKYYYFDGTERKFWDRYDDEGNLCYSRRGCRKI